MRTSIVPALGVVACGLALAGCASRHVQEELGSDLRDFGVLAQPAAEEIPLYSEFRVPGCPHRVAGELASASLLGLRDAAHQKLAHAVVGVRRHVLANGRARNHYESPPAASVYYTGLAVRFGEGGCPAADAYRASSLLPT